MGNRVGFVGWMVGWMVEWLDGKEIFEYISDRSGPKTRAKRGHASLCSECIRGVQVFSTRVPTSPNFKTHETFVLHVFRLYTYTSIPEL